MDRVSKNSKRLVKVEIHRNSVNNVERGVDEAVVDIVRLPPRAEGWDLQDSCAFNPFLVSSDRLTTSRDRFRWRPGFYRRARCLPVALASLGLLIGVGAAGFATSAHVYVVQPGDSLWAISRANGLTMQQLAAANNMNLNDILLIGRHLLIPSNQPAAPVGSLGQRYQRGDHRERLDIL